MMLDTHIHLTDQQYDNIRNDIIKEYFVNDNNVMLIGCEKQAFETTIFLAQRLKSYCAIGFHPIEFENINFSDLKMLENLLINNKVDFIGEIGLDYYWFPNNKEEQKKLFRYQLRLAEKYNKPVTIHSRNALDDTYEILKEFPQVRGIIHSFSGDINQAKKFIELGYLLGISGPITFKNGINQQKVVKNFNIENFILETDGPYLTPVPYRGKINKPNYITFIAEKIGHIKNIPTYKILEITKKNFERFINNYATK